MYNLIYGKMIVKKKCRFLENIFGVFDLLGFGRGSRNCILINIIGDFGVDYLWIIF